VFDAAGLRKNRRTFRAGGFFRLAAGNSPQLHYLAWGALDALAALAGTAACAGSLPDSGGSGLGMGGTTGRYNGPLCPHPAKASTASVVAKAVTIALVRKTTGMTESGKINRWSLA